MKENREEINQLRDGEPCSHAGCLSHISHPCEGCGRIGGIPMYKKYKLASKEANFTYELFKDIDVDPAELGKIKIFEITNMGSLLNGVWRIIVVNRATEMVKCRKLEEISCSIDDGESITHEKFLLDPKDWKPIIGHSE